jgi:adenylosuccinate lyase
LVYSQRVLLGLTQAGISREEAYKLVQKHAMKTWEHGKDFFTELSKDKDVTSRISTKDLKKLFDTNHFTRHTDTIFKRVFGK